MNTAQKISDQFNNDGQCYENSDGVEWQVVVNSHKPTHTRSGSNHKYVFDDGSCLIDCDRIAWDIGINTHKDCYCWVGERWCRCEDTISDDTE